MSTDALEAERLFRHLSPRFVGAYGHSFYPDSLRRLGIRPRGSGRGLENAWAPVTWRRLEQDGRPASSAGNTALAGEMIYPPFRNTRVTATALRRLYRPSQPVSEQDDALLIVAGFSSVTSTLTSYIRGFGE